MLSSPPVIGSKIEPRMIEPAHLLPAPHGCLGEEADREAPFVGGHLRAHVGRARMAAAGEHVAAPLGVDPHHVVALAALRGALLRLRRQLHQHVVERRDGAVRLL
eukprot:2484813-Pyramimonas_sp.AAC.1